MLEDVRDVLIWLALGLSVWLGAGVLIAFLFGAFVSLGRHSWELDENDREPEQGTSRNSAGNKSQSPQYSGYANAGRSPVILELGSKSDAMERGRGYLINPYRPSGRHRYFPN
jgi:hypothetical protein